MPLYDNVPVLYKSRSEKNARRPSAAELLEHPFIGLQRDTHAVAAHPTLLDNEVARMKDTTAATRYIAELKVIFRWSRTYN